MLYVIKPSCNPKGHIIINTYWFYEYWIYETQNIKMNKIVTARMQCEARKNEGSFGVDVFLFFIVFLQ